STDAGMTARLIDRPLRPAFAHGVRNVARVVVAVTSIAPGELYDTVAINAASMSTTLSVMDFAGPIGAVRIALVADEDGTTQWVAFLKHSQLKNAVFNMAVAGRIADDDIAVMMVEAEAIADAWDTSHDKGASAPPAESDAEGL